MDENQDLVNRLYDAAWARGDVESAAGLLTAELVDHDAIPITRREARARRPDLSHILSGLSRRRCRMSVLSFPRVAEKIPTS